MEDRSACGGGSWHGEGVGVDLPEDSSLSASVSLAVMGVGRSSGSGLELCGRDDVPPMLILARGLK